jgi:acetate kinase
LVRVLVLNCGGSSLKYQLLEMPTEQVLARGSVERIGRQDAVVRHERPLAQPFVRGCPVADHQHAIAMALETLLDPEVGAVADPTDIDAVGHRVVHGGETYTGSVRITKDVLQTLEDFYELAPLHNPPNVTGIRACQKLMPHAVMVAVFDSGLHQAMPPAHFTYAIPYELYEKYRVRRYGFHGITFRYMTGRVAQLMRRSTSELKIVSLMLGSGTTANAFCHGRSVDVSTGLTPTEGLVQSTRCGDIDPLAVTFLMRKEGLDADAMDALLNQKSGWLGISGISSDYREVAEAAAQGNARARLAIDAFVYRCRKYVGAYAAAMGGIDTLVFSGGVGERSAGCRARICQNMGFLGIALDAEANIEGPAERCISTGPVQVWVIPTNEEIVIARDTYALALSGDSYLSHVG